MTTFIKSKFVKAAIGLLAIALVVAGVGSAKAAETFTLNLAKGSNNSQVKSLQDLLDANGFVVAASGVGSAGNTTTYFGSLTEKAVMAFQTAHNISSIGKVGPQTRAALNAIVDGGGSMAPAPAAGTLCPNGNTMASNCSMAPNGTMTPPAQGSGPVTVSLASDNPAAGYLVAGQATADLAHFNFNGSGTISSITLQRTGLSNNPSLSNVYLYNGATRLTDSSTVNSVGVITFPGVNLMVNGSTTISVKADLASSANGQTVGVTLTGYTVTGSSMTTANVAGNVFSVSNGSGILGGASFTIPSPATPSINAGATQYVVWTAPVQINLHTMWLKSAAFHFVGSAPNDAMANLSMYVDGTKVGSSTGINQLGYVVFDLSAAPLSLATGSHTVDVRADIIKGSARTIQLTLQNPGDFMVTDSQVGVNVAVCDVTCGTVNASFSPLAGPSLSILQGTLSIQLDPSFTAMTNVISGGTNQTIAKYTVTAYGEDQKIQTITLPVDLSGTVAPATNGLNNVQLFFNGSQVGSVCQATGGPTLSTCSFTLGSSLIAVAGATGSLEVRADMQNAAGANYTSGVIKVLGASIPLGSIQGMSSLQTNSLAAVSLPNTTGLSIQAGVVAVSKNPAYSSQVMNANTPNAKIGSFILQNQSTSEAVRVTDFQVGIAMTTAGSTNYSNLKTSETSGQGSIPVNPVTATAPGTSVNNFSVNFTIAPGSTKVIDVFADIGPTAGNATVITQLALNAIGATSNVTLCTPSGVAGNGCVGYKAGQTITVGTGTFNLPAIVTSGSTLGQNVAGGTTDGTTDATKAEFRVTAASGNATITELGFKDLVGGDTLTQIRVGGVTAPVAANKAFLYGLSIPVPQGGAGTTVDAFSSYSPVGSQGIAEAVTGVSLTSQLELSYIKYTIGGLTTTECFAGDAPGGGTCSGILALPVTSAQTMVLVGSKPTVTVSQPTSSVFAVGSKELIDVTITADQAGPITINSFPIQTSLSLSGGATATFSTGVGNPFLVYDASNSPIAVDNTSNFTNPDASGGATVTLTGGYLLSAGQSVTFKVYAPVATAVAGTTSQSIIANTSLVKSSGFTWTDTAANAAISTGDVTGNIFNYPSNITSQIHN